MFEKASENSDHEKGSREKRGLNLLRYGVSFLDDALKGITSNDLILIGAQSGIGKTALCCSIALTNIEDGKKVHYIALEAEKYEIESRLKFKIISEMYFSDQNRPLLEPRFNFSNWYRGTYLKELKKYEDQAHDFFIKAFSNLYLYYKEDLFGLDQFIESVAVAAEKTDLIIVDHVHYFDLEDENENRSMKQIASKARSIALEIGKPIILVGHLRKKDRHNNDLVPDMYEFHGSSDLYKIATTVITFAPGNMTDQGNYITYFRIPKYRIDGGVTKYLGKISFNPKKGGYEKPYKLGRSTQNKDADFEEVDRHLYPSWASRPATSGEYDLRNEEQQTVERKRIPKIPDTAKFPYREN